jgi:hypothetical protein
MSKLALFLLGAGGWIATRHIVLDRPAHAGDIAIGATLFAGSALTLLANAKSNGDGLGDARHQLYSMPRRYWVPDLSKQQRNCYSSKSEALMRFAKFNSRVIDNYNGMEHDESPAEFDAINAKYGLTGKDRVTNISQAIWVSLPPSRPYCLDNIDIETLNRTSPAREDPLGIGFLIPDYAIVDRLNREQAELFREQEQGGTSRRHRSSD